MSTTITMKYGERTVTIEQEETDEVLLEIRENNKFIGYLLGSDLLELLDRKRLDRERSTLEM